MTGRSPNVFYEVGYAHALNKRVVLLTQNADDIPFDLKHYPHIVYGGKITQLKSELERRIRWCIDNPTRTLPTVDLEFEFSVNGISIYEGCEVQIPFEEETNLGVVSRYGDLGSVSTGAWLFSIRLGIHNLSSKIAEASRYRLALVVPASFGLMNYDSDEVVTLADERKMIRLRPQTTLFPDDWGVFGLMFRTEMEDRLRRFALFDFALRLFLELGPKEIPFRVSFVPNGE